MGEVWLAWDERLEREVAVKILPEADSSDQNRRKRFLREARLASSLNHPGIVAIYDVNAADGLDYMAMELVRGETLVQRLKRGKLDAVEARAIIRQVASALAVAHAAGITHRDLKPSNIMIGEGGIVKVLDFGLAQLEEPVTGEETRTQLTAAGAVLGTYGYMAPEQLLGERADPRSDVFSLGVVWFELLTGESPFRGQTRSEQMRRMLSEGSRDVRSVVRGIPEPDAAALMRCLAAKPEDRFRDAGEMLPALGKEETRGVKRSWVAAVLFLSAVGLASGVAYWRGTTKDPGTPKVTGDLAAARSAMERYDIPGRLELAVAEAEAVLKREPGSASAYQVLAQAKVFEHYVKRDALIAKQAEGWARKAVELDEYMGSAHSVLGWALSLAGKLDEAERPLRQGLELNPRSHVAHLGMASWAGRKRLPEEAERHYRDAEEASPNSWYVFAMGGSYHYGNGEYEKARGSFERALRLTPDNVRVMNSLSSAYHQLGRDEEAIATLQKAIEIRPSATMYTNLGTLLFFAGRYAQALPAMRKAVELDSGNATKWGNLADTLRWVPGRREESIEAYRTAMRLVREKMANSADDPVWNVSLAVYAAKSGRREEAQQSLDRAMLAKKLTPEVAYQAGVAAELLGERKRALELIKKAVVGGYARQDIRNDPELSNLRQDSGYRLMEGELEDMVRRNRK